MPPAYRLLQKQRYGIPAALPFIRFGLRWRFRRTDRRGATLVFLFGARQPCLVEVIECGAFFRAFDQHRSQHRLQAVVSIVGQSGLQGE